MSEYIETLASTIREVLKAKTYTPRTSSFWEPPGIGLSEHELAAELLRTGKVTVTNGAAATPGKDDLQPSPHELLRRVFDCDEDKRVTWATAVLAQSGIAFICWHHDHEGTIHSLREEVAALQAQVQQYERRLGV